MGWEILTESELTIRNLNAIIAKKDDLLNKACVLLHSAYCSPFTAVRADPIWQEISNFLDENDR